MSKIIESMKVGEQVRLRLFLKSIEVRQTNTRPPKNFLNITLFDGESEINGKLWNYVTTMPAPPAKCCVDVVANVGEYNGNKQLTISAIMESVDQDASPFMPSIGCDPKLLWEAIVKAIGNISDTTMQAIVRDIYEANKTKLMMASSACNVHHVGIGGNLLHTLEVFNIVTVLGPLYQNVNLSLMQAGALLHDIGKAYVYQIEGAAVDYTDIGYLYDHLAYGAKMLDDYATGISDQATKNRIDLLRHIILSHHGTKEYGSPVTPKFIEAWLVNYADGISATVNTITNEVTKKGEDEQHTDRIYTCGNGVHLTPSYIDGLLNNNVCL